jgi:hypothetical protein
MIAVTANITLPMDGPVTTTLDQCLLSGPVYVSQKGNVTEVPLGSHAFERPEFFWHNNVAYVIKPGQPVLLRNEVATGSWRNISSAGSPSVDAIKTFTLEIDHGTGPHGSTAFYAGVCVCVCMCMWQCVCVCVCVCMYLCVCMHVFACLCVCLSLSLCHRLCAR